MPSFSARASSAPSPGKWRPAGRPWSWSWSWPARIRMLENMIICAIQLARVAHACRGAGSAASAQPDMPSDDWSRGSAPRDGLGGRVAVVVDFLATDNDKILKIKILDNILILSLILIVFIFIRTRQPAIAPLALALESSRDARGAAAAASKQQLTATIIENIIRAMRTTLQLFTISSRFSEDIMIIRAIRTTIHPALHDRLAIHQVWRINKSCPPRSSSVLNVLKSREFQVPATSRSPSSSSSTIKHQDVKLLPVIKLLFGGVCKSGFALLIAKAVAIDHTILGKHPAL
ncbi:hypothetical protein H9P43_007987 [Blastocladiella emersonii ATCC 22665]|nr:hypothetical protein H9P43_007987 [Blastocladiella emersonii ATCC 22665]